MSTRASHTFEHPIDEVWAMFNDVDSHVAKFEGMGHREVEVLDFSAGDGRVYVKIRRVVELELPSFAKRFVKPVNTVTSTDRWTANDDGTYGGTFSADAKGTPVKISGTTRLEPDGPERTDYEITVDLAVNVPLVGGKLSDWASGNVDRQLRDEFDAGDTWLDAH
jgi:hypothetical protein